jgi:hypothetical protein
LHAIKGVVPAGSLVRATSYKDFTGPRRCFVALPGNAKEFMETVAVGVLQLNDEYQALLLHSTSK